MWYANSPVVAGFYDYEVVQFDLTWGNVAILTDEPSTRVLDRFSLKLSKLLPSYDPNSKIVESGGIGSL